jgi:hypothetical protein
MPLPTITDTFRCVLNWTGQSWSTNAVNVIHIRMPSADSGDVFTMLDGDVTSAMWGHTENNIGVESVDITPLDGSSASENFPTGLPSKWKGAQTGGFDPVPQVAAIIKLGTALRGRSYRGRIYLPWPVENQILAGQLNSVTVGTMNSAWSTFLGAVIADLAELVVASYKNSTAEAVTSAECETFLGTVRRRQPRA